MSADIIPMPAPQEPAPPSNITPLPSAAPAPVTPQLDAISKLLKNPFVIAGGALLAGMALTRLLATPSMQKLARDLADEALRRARQAPAEDQPHAPSLLEEAIGAVRPQVTEAARSFLAQILKKS
jgi:hypothetical protein